MKRLTITTISLITPISEAQQTRIVNNILAACEDIYALNEIGYQFLAGAYGFDHHRNLYGFVNYYADHSLSKDIIKHRNDNTWDYYHEGPLYEYYMGKRAAYDRVYAYHVSRKAVYLAVLKGLSAQP